MRTRVKSESSILNSVQTFSSLAQMKFKPSSQQGTTLLKQRKDQLIKNKKQYAELYDPVSMVLQADRKIENSQPRRLKFLVSLSADHFLVGNQNQIDMIGFGGIVHNFVDTDFYWSFSLKTPIESISVDSKKSVMLILSETTIYFYQYTIKSKELPVLISQYSVKQGVKFIRFLKDSLLGIFYSNSFEIYNIENLLLIKKKLDKAYPIGNQRKLLTIPPSIDNIINVFFEEPKEKKQSFILWCLQINFESEHIKTRPLYRVYDIMNYAKGKLSIQNYTKDTIFMNLNHQIMAIKNGYLIDTVNLSVKEDGQILKYIHPNTILHVTKKSLEVYNFFIDMSVKPQKISLKSIDSIEFTKIPQNVFYISILKTFHNNFAVFFQDSNKKQFQTKGEITYYFEISQNTTFKDKISSLFDTIGTNINNPQIVSEKFNTALKMGLSEKEIYVHLWNKSQKTSLEDYQYILATKDYKIIKAEIEKKLKKESMVLRQILRIEESCHQINKELVESPQCSQENIKDYVCSHFLLKKLRLYKEIKVLNRLSLVEPSDLSEGTNESRQLKIDIQQYYQYKNVDMKTYLIDQINDMLFNLKNNAKIIRITIKIFKFVYRLLYKNILKEIIINAKDSLIDLLNELPELLPYFHLDLTEEQRKEGLYEGIWGNIGDEEWQKELYPQSILTIHNKQTLADLMKSVWFKRFWMTSHGCTYRDRKSVIEMNQFNNSDKIFYFFISKLYEHSKNNKPQYYQTIHFLQEKYELFPSHLKGKTVLYQNLYIYYFNEEQNNPSRLSFEEFLDWDDQLLFSYFFNHEKIKKNSLLKEIKPIYQQSDTNGPHLFNIGLFSYFYSDRSEISDLKFILNRINNQKVEFHLKNKGIYEVLIKSIQFKLRLGSGQDIPMDQIMIYVQNILLEQEGILQEIQIMENIKSQVELFQEMKINMTIKEIMDNFESVTTKIIQYKLKSQDVMSRKSYEAFRIESVAILTEVERIANKIYIISQNTNYTLLVYLSLILQDQFFIDFVTRLLQDEAINNLFEIQGTTIQNLVLFMYKERFSKSNKYIDHATYIKKLLELLPSDNQCRNYLDNQLEIGLVLSSQQVPFKFPLSKNAHHPNSEVIKQCFKAQKKQFLLSLDLEKLHSLLKKLEFFNISSNVEEKNLKQTLSLHKLYQLMIVQLLEKGAYKEVIDYIYKIQDLEGPIENIGIIYVALYIYKTAKQFNEESRRCIFKLLAMFFNHPKSLMKAIEINITTEQTSLQKTQYLKAIIDQENARTTFNHYSDSILRKEFTSHHQDPNSKIIIEAYRQYLKSKSQQFERNFEYDVIFTFLCMSPYKLIKFIELEKNHLRIKQIYNFVMMTITRPIFHRRKSLQVTKRIFAALFMCIKNIKDCDQLVKTFENKTTEEEFQIPKLTKLNDKEQTLYKIAKNVAKIQTKWQQSETREKDKQKLILEVRATMKNPSLIADETCQIEEDQHSKLQYSGNEELPKKIKIDKIDFDYPQEMRNYFFRTIPFEEFVVKSKDDKVSHELSLIKKHSAAPIITLKSGKKDSNYLNTRNKIIEHLYSHKVVAGSEYHDDGTRKDDEDFLDSFLPKPDSRTSQVSVSSSRGKSSSHSRSKSKSRPKFSKQDSIQLPKMNEKKVTLVDSDLLDIKEIQTQSNVNPEDHQQTPNTTNNITKYQLLREHLMKSYNETKIPKFDITPLEKQLQQIQQTFTEENIIQKKKEEFFHNFFASLYNQPLEILNLNLKLMEEVGRKHPEAGLNIFFLQAYERIYATHTKHGFDMGIAQLLPLKGLFVISKNIVDLYQTIEPYITPKITDENIFKLSKLIALGFRKSVVEQQILFNYLKMTMSRFIESQESELQEIKEKIKGIIYKLQIPTIVEKGESLFKELKLGERRTLLLENYMETLKHKGYGTAAKELQSKVG